VWVLPTTAEISGMPFAQSLVRTRTESLEEGGRESQTRHWISSLEIEETGARRFGQLTRGHWNIENGSHRQRDVLWREDHHHFQHHGRAWVMASLRQLALWMHSTTLRRSQGDKPRPISHQIHALKHAPADAIPLLTRDCRE
jgi:predicted transposase YbfD/YdcC